MPLTVPLTANAHGQPIGPAVVGWSERAWPTAATLTNEWVALERLTLDHVPELALAYLPVVEENWTYVGSPPPHTLPDVAAIVADQLARDWVTYVVRVAATGRVEGMLSLLRIEVAAGSIEIGSVLFGVGLQRTPASTAAQRLLMGYVLDDLGYRRLEWKCDALNAPSMRAAQRLGYTFEGIFRQAMIYKGRNRDTAWWSITDGDWPTVRSRLDAWLTTSNFDAAGCQRSALGEV